MTTHAKLVERAVKWLRDTRRHTVVLCETKTLVTDEEPDVIGWKGSGASSLLEVKASRADFHADKKKPFRVHPYLGMGRERWYATEPGLLTIEDLPEGWGLVEFGRAPRVIRGPRPFLERNVYAELVLSLSACRRATEGWGQKIFGDIAQTDALHPARERRLAKLERQRRAGRLGAPAESNERDPSDPRVAFEAAFPKLPVRGAT